MDTSTQIANSIIRAQEKIIGPVAIEQAQKVEGIKFDETNSNISIQGDKKMIIENLVKQYEKLFGPASIEVCRNAVKNMINTAPKEQIPSLLL